MQLNHSFTVPLPVDEAFAILRDVQRIAPCMPGATLDEVDGDRFTGGVKVKVGPITVTYRGEARFVDVDEEKHVATIEAAGKETRGSGTARATVRAELRQSGDGTEVEMTTELAVTGKPAQFGRGVMADVGGKLVQQFADCLARELSDRQTAAAGATQERGHPVPGEPPEVVRTAEAGPGSVRPSDEWQARREAPPIDLFDVAGAPVAKRLAPVAAAAAVLALIVWLVRRRA